LAPKFAPVTSTANELTFGSCVWTNGSVKSDNILVKLIVASGPGRQSS
jgi:hypothetical protein